MKGFGEGKALVVSILSSTAALLGMFALAAVIRSAQPAANVGSVSGALVAEVKPTPELAAAGRHLFLMNCAHCHGDDARGDEGPDLHALHKSDGRIHQVITSGIKGEMPSFANKLKDPDIRALTAYLRTLS